MSLVKNYYLAGFILPITCVNQGTKAFAAIWRTDIPRQFALF